MAHSIIDVFDILDVEQPESTNKVSSLFNLSSSAKSQKKKKDKGQIKRPEGINRELYALYADNKDNPPLFIDTDQGYKQNKVNFCSRNVRPWKWMKFKNSGRKDGFQLSHWRHLDDENEEYAFAKFNKHIDILEYTDADYNKYLQLEGWSKEETDHLFDLCNRFDLRFVIIHDRWDRERFVSRSIEDLKERYYDIWNILSRARTPANVEPQLIHYDAEHERRRKQQLEKLYNRTAEQVKEEEWLMQQLKKIELRKREREKKTQDLQKLITAADGGDKKIEKKGPKRKVVPQKNKSEGMSFDAAGIKFPDFKGSGVYIRSQKMKLPASVGQRKTKAIEQLLKELEIESNPIPTENVSAIFNEIRNDMVLLYELKLALSNCEFEMQTLKHQEETAKIKMDTQSSSTTFAFNPPTTERVFKFTGNSGASPQADSS